MTTYLNRSAWTSTAAGGSTLTGSILKGVAIHYPGSPQDVIGDPGQASIANRLRGYRDYHVNTRGWSDIGYNFAIDQGGRVWMCRSTLWKGNRVGAHCASATNQDANHEYVGVLLVIGDQETPNAKMIAAFRDWYFNRFLPGWPGRTDVRGHGKVPGASTACPGSRTLALISAGAFTTKPSTPPPSGEDDWMAFIENQADFNTAMSAWWNSAMDISGGPVADTPETTRLRAIPVHQMIGRVRADGTFDNVHRAFGVLLSLGRAFGIDKLNPDDPTPLLDALLAANDDETVTQTIQAALAEGLDITLTVDTDPDTP